MGWGLPKGNKPIKYACCHHIRWHFQCCFRHNSRGDTRTPKNKACLPSGVSATSWRPTAMTTSSVCNLSCKYCCNLYYTSVCHTSSKAQLKYGYCMMRPDMGVYFGLLGFQILTLPKWSTQSHPSLQFWIWWQKLRRWALRQSMTIWQSTRKSFGGNTS